jgi:hypothetical protein
MVVGTSGKMTRIMKSKSALRGPRRRTVTGSSASPMPRRQPESCDGGHPSQPQT